MPVKLSVAAAVIKMGGKVRRLPRYGTAEVLKYPGADLKVPKERNPRVGTLGFFWGTNLSGATRQLPLGRRGKSKKKII